MLSDFDEARLLGCMQVDADRSALDKEKWALRGAGASAGDVVHANT